MYLILISSNFFSLNNMRMCQLMHYNIHVKQCKRFAHGAQSPHFSPGFINHIRNHIRYISVVDRHKQRQKLIGMLFIRNGILIVQSCTTVIRCKHRTNIRQLNMHNYISVAWFFISVRHVKHSWWFEQTVIRTDWLRNQSIHSPHLGGNKSEERIQVQFRTT